MRALAAVAVGLVLFAGTAGGATKAASVRVYPATTTIAPNPAPTVRPTTSIALHAAIGGHDDAIVLVSGAAQVSVQAPALTAPLQLKLFLAHYVAVDNAPVPDALEPWDGSQHPSEQHNQPIWVQVTVPDGTAPGTYTGSLAVLADGVQTTVPLTVQVFPVTLPQPNQVEGSLLTAFNVASQSYGNMVAKFFGVSGPQTPIVQQLYAFLASYRISPTSFGYGDPHSVSGYTTDKRWWLDPQTNVLAEVGDRAFAAMPVPISNNRTTPADWIAGLSPVKPQDWCAYLQAVHGFWSDHGWLASWPFVYGMDEPGLSGFRVVGQQASAVHRCFPGGHEIVTGNPSDANRFLWNGGTDDVDAWVVLPNRFYGKFTVPKLSREGVSNATVNLKRIEGARSRGAQIWTYTYAGTGVPGFTATEPLADSRMVFLWAALEHVTGVLYGEGVTTYRTGQNPLDRLDRAGAFVLVYPGKSAPIPSARLEQIRNGIEDWEVLNIVREKHGLGAVRSILGKAGLFSASAAGVKLACTVGCALHSSTAFAFPRWSNGATSPPQIEAARVAALRAAS